MYIASITDIIDLNHVLEENNLSYRIHLRDSCGKQSMWVELLGECGNEGKEEMVKGIIKNYFINKKAEIVFSTTGFEFVIV